MKQRAARPVFCVRQKKERLWPIRGRNSESAEKEYKKMKLQMRFSILLSGRTIRVIRLIREIRSLQWQLQWQWQWQFAAFLKNVARNRNTLIEIFDLVTDQLLASQRVPGEQEAPRTAVL